MALDDRFKQYTIVTLAKRAANLCSNPDCRAITSGPAEEVAKSVNVGEAAHIFGAKPGSARYVESMSSDERSDITNAIWLCTNCHKTIDDNPQGFPAGLLFEWQKMHTEYVGSMVGKTGIDARRRYEARHFEELGSISYLSERIISEKGDYWEYKLTAEVLRYEMDGILRRWAALNRGLYIKPVMRIGQAESLPWIQDRIAEASKVAHALGELLNVEFARAWGEPGTAGEEADIIFTSRLFAEVCSSCLNWEEAVRFTILSEAFEEVRGLFVGVAGTLIEECRKVPEFLRDTMAKSPTEGVFRLSIVLDLPEGWDRKVGAALERACYQFERSIR